MQHTRPPCPSPTPRVHSNSCPSSQWCHPAISSSVVPFSSCPESLPASKSFPMSQLFAWGCQSIGVSALASFLPKNTQDWSPLEWTGWISLQSKGLSKVRLGACKTWSRNWLKIFFISLISQLFTHLCKSLFLSTWTNKNQERKLKIVEKGLGRTRRDKIKILV